MDVKELRGVLDLILIRTERIDAGGARIRRRLSLWLVRRIAARGGGFVFRMAQNVR